MKGENRIKAHLTLLRLFATAGIIPPMLLGFALAQTMDFMTFIIALVGSAFILYGTHYHNSYSDYKRGIDRGETAKRYTSASAILPLGLVSLREVVIGAVTLYLIGTLTWLYLALNTTPLALIPPALGLACGILYNTHGKYAGYGEFLLAVAFGLACTLAGFIPAARTLTIQPFLIALIPGLLWSLFYTMDQAQDAKFDRRIGLKNIVAYLSGVNFPLSRYLEFGFFITILLHLFFILINWLPPITFLSLIVTPLMFIAILTADVEPPRSAVFLILTFGFYVLITALVLLFSTQMLEG